MLVSGRSGMWCLHREWGEFLFPPFFLSKSISAVGAADPCSPCVTQPTVMAAPAKNPW